MAISFPFHEWRHAPQADFCVIGDPVAHSRSPQMHGAAYAALGLPYRYERIRVDAGEVGEALEHLRDLGYRGVNVTVPHKEEAYRWASVHGGATGLAERIRAANTVNLETRQAINTDGPGFLDTLDGIVPGRALVLGAGGSARAMVPAMEEAGWSVCLWNRTHERAVSLVQELGLRADVVREPHLQGFDLIVNATSSGLLGDGIPLDWSSAESGGLAYDLLYGDTAFLREARSRGLRTIDGLPLLVAQGARSLEWWLGVPAPREAMLKALI